MSIVVSAVAGQRWGNTFAGSPSVMMPQQQIISRPQPQVISMPGAQVIAMPQQVAPQQGQKALGKPGGVSKDELKKFKELFAKAHRD